MKPTIAIQIKLVLSTARIFHCSIRQAAQLAQVPRHQRSRIISLARAGRHA